MNQLIIRRKSNGQNYGNFQECFTVGLSKPKQGWKENRLFKLIMHAPGNIHTRMACQKLSFETPGPDYK